MARVENGVFTYTGLPARFNPTAQASSKESTERCLFCNQSEMCGLILTRAKAKREAEEDKLEQVKMDNQGNHQNSKPIGSKALQGWLKRSNKFLQWTGLENLMDTNYVIKCKMSIDKQDYMAILGKMYRLEQLLRTFAYLVAVHRA